MRNLIYDFKLLWPFIGISKDITQKNTKTSVVKAHKEKKDTFRNMFEDALSEASKSVSKTMGYTCSEKL